MWRGEVRRGRAGQAFDCGEPGVLDGATAKSLAASRHGPRQVGQIVKTKPLRRSCLRILDQSLEPREPALQASCLWPAACDAVSHDLTTSAIPSSLMARWNRCASRGAWPGTRS